MLLSMSSGPGAFRLVPALRYSTIDELPDGQQPLCLDLLIPDPPPTRPTPMVVFFHGGGWAEGDRSTGLYPWLNPLLASHGFITASVTYRLSRFAPFPAQIHDAKAAIRWLKAHAHRYTIDPDRIGVWGDSAGGHLAALLGTSAGVPELEGTTGSPDQPSTVHAVVTRCAPSDLTRFHPRDQDQPGSVLWHLFGGRATTQQVLARLASPVTHIPASTPPPFLVVHGTHDETVPYSQALLLVQALRDHGGHATLRTIPGGHHNLLQNLDLPWTDTPWTALGQEALAFFFEHLQPTPLGTPTRTPSPDCGG
jgi:acetyl esterase/lipase